MKRELLMCLFVVAFLSCVSAKDGKTISEKINVSEYPDLYFLPNASSISDFRFIENEKLNVLVVIGSKAPAMDFVSATDISARLGSLVNELNEPIARLDIEVTSVERERYNLIQVGGPVVNDLVRELQEEGKLSMEITYESPGPGKGLIMYVRDPYGTGKDVLIVAGSDREGTKKASLALFDILYNNEDVENPMEVKTEKENVLVVCKEGVVEEKKVQGYVVRIVGVSEKYGVMVEILKDGKVVARNALVPDCDEREGLVYNDIYVEASEVFVGDC